MWREEDMPAVRVRAVDSSEKQGQCGEKSTCQRLGLGLGQCGEKTSTCQRLGLGLGLEVTMWREDEYMPARLGLGLGLGQCGEKTSTCQRGATTHAEVPQGHRGMGI